MAVNMSCGSKPFTASSTRTASSTVRQCTPARSPALSCPGPPFIMMPFVATKLTTLLREAGPLHEPAVCSQMPQAARFADTEIAEPLLVPLGTRSVSYGLHGWPLHGASWRFWAVGKYVFGFDGPSAPTLDTAAVVTA